MPDQLFADPVQTNWTRPKKPGTCGRNPSAGPGTCRHWWDICIANKDAAKWGCFAVWAQEMHRLGYVPGEVSADHVTARLPGDGAAS